MIPRSMMPNASIVRRLSLRLTRTRRRASVFAILLTCLLAAWVGTIGAGAAGGSLDMTFQDPMVTGDPDASVDALAVQPDGKVLIGGNFFTVGGQQRQGAARLNADGTLDTTFQNPAVLFSSRAIRQITALVVQPDGKVVIGGNFISVGGQTRTGVARLNADGTLDTTFQNPATNDDFIVQIIGLVVQPDGKIVIGGFFSSVGGQARQHVARLNPDGTLDTTFQNPAFDHDSGDLFVQISAFAVQPDGKVLTVGRFELVGGQARGGVARLNADGTLDTTLQNPSAKNSVRACAVQPDGKVLIGGGFDSVGGQTRGGVARLNADGTLDTTFQNPLTYNNVFALALQPDGKVLVGGPFTRAAGQPQQRVARLNTDGIKGRRSLRGFRGRVR